MSNSSPSSQGWRPLLVNLAENLTGRLWSVFQQNNNPPPYQRRSHIFTENIRRRAVADCPSNQDAGNGVQFRVCRGTAYRLFSFKECYRRVEPRPAATEIRAKRSAAPAIHCRTTCGPPSRDMTPLSPTGMIISKIIVLVVRSSFQR